MIRKVRLTGTGFDKTRDTLLAILGKVGMSTVDTGIVAQHDTLVQHGLAINANAQELEDLVKGLDDLKAKVDALPLA